MLLCILIASFLGVKSDEINLLFLILINQFLASFILYLRANLGGLQLFKTESVISVLDRTLMIAIVGYLLINPSTSGAFKIKWFVATQTFAYSIALVISIIIVSNRTKPIRFVFNFKDTLSVLNRLKPYALLVLLMALYYRADSLFLVKLLPDGEVQAGIYAHAFRILDFMSNYALLFPILLLPIFSKIIHSKQKIEGLLNLSSLLLIIPSVIIICPALFYRNELFSILYPEFIGLSADTFAILTISYLGMCISYTFGALLTANGNLNQLNIMAAIAVVISLLLNLLLIPHLKVVGAAIANASAQLFTIVFHIVLTVKIFKLKVSVPIILKLIGFVLSIAVLGFVIKKLAISWILGSAILVAFGFLIAFLSGLLNIRGMVTLIKNQEFR